MGILKIIKISRPLVWSFIPLVFFFGLYFSGESLTLISLLQMVSFTFPLCFYAYGINDIYDLKSDKINPRKSSELHGAKITKADIQFIKRLSLFLIIIIFSISLLTKNIENIILTSLLIITAYIYSVPPIRLKEKPPLDSIINGIGYVYLPAAIGFSYGNSIIDIPVKAYFLISCVIAIHAFSTLADYKADSNAKQKTFAIRFGKMQTILFSLLIFMITAIFSGISSIIINIYLYACIILLLINLLLPKEKVFQKSFIIIFLASLIFMFVYLISL